jgi:imidazolonepropionase-like amidohydrolase
MRPTELRIFFAIALCIAFCSGFLLRQRGSIGSEVQAPIRRNAPILIRAGRLLLVESGNYANNQGILVKDTSIIDLGDFKAVRDRNPAVKVIDLSRATVLPGLIDCHTHLFSASDGRLDTTAKLSEPERLQLGEKHAREYLESGVTTIRDLGHSVYRALLLRDRINAGQIIGPEIFAAGRKLTPPGGQRAPSASTPNFTLNSLELTGGPENARRAAREVIQYLGADIVKVVVNDGQRLLSVEDVSAIVDEAHRTKIKVAAHATSTAAIKIAVKAGVDSIEHGNDVTPEILNDMRERGIFLIPNSFTEGSLRQIFAAELRRNPADEADFATFIKDSLQQSQRRLRLAMEAKVRIAAGSDMIFIYPGKTRGEASIVNLLAMHEQGMPAIDVLRAATINAAELLGISNSSGSIQKGKAANLIAVDGDPLTDISVIEKVSFVMKQGIIHLNTN